MTPEAIEAICKDVRNAMTDIVQTVDQTQLHQLGDSSTLPGWNRAQVLSHICGIARAIARQFDYARAGKLVDLYDGGAQGRLDDIESRMSIPFEELKQAIAANFHHLSASLQSMNEADWSRNIAYRNGTAKDALLAVWRELIIHHADLRLGYTSADWSKDFCSHLFDFLSPRVPNGLMLELDITGERKGSTTVGRGASRVVMSGSRQDLAAWLAGRNPLDKIEYRNILLPKLGPWPPAPPTQ